MLSEPSAPRAQLCRLTLPLPPFISHTDTLSAALNATSDIAFRRRPTCLRLRIERKRGGTDERLPSGPSPAAKPWERPWESVTACLRQTCCMGGGEPRTHRHRHPQEGRRSRMGQHHAGTGRRHQRGGMAKSGQPSDQSRPLMFSCTWRPFAWRGWWWGAQTMRWKLKFDGNKQNKRPPERLSNAERMS